MKYDIWSAGFVNWLHVLTISCRGDLLTYWSTWYDLPSSNRCLQRYNDTRRILSVKKLTVKCWLLNAEWECIIHGMKDGVYCALSRTTVLLSHCQVLLYHLDSMQNATVRVHRLSVLSMPKLLPKMKMGGQLLLVNKRRMDPGVWIKNKRIYGWDESTVGFIGCSKNLHDWERGKL